MSFQSADKAYLSGIKSYVLRSGRKTDAQQRAYNEFSQKYLIPFENNIVNFSEIFGNNNPVTAEIGFGMGEATAIIASENPDRNFIGIEVHKPGIGKLILQIEKLNLSNIRIIEHDAVEVFEKMIPRNSLDEIHIFFPDPWPKKRHHKRRLVKHPFTAMLCAALKNSGYIYMVTDWEDYANWALAELSSTKMLVNSTDGFALPQEWRPRTSFEKKGLAKKHLVKELMFLRKDMDVI